jgi:YggT family protein
MFIIGFLLLAVARVFDFILLFFMIFIIARAVLSWVSPDPYNPIVRFIHNATEPVLVRIRTKIPVVYGGIDFSPLIVFLVIIFLRDFLVKSIAGMGRSLL